MTVDTAGVDLGLVRGNGEADADANDDFFFSFYDTIRLAHNARVKLDLSSAVEW